MTSTAGRRPNRFCHPYRIPSLSNRMYFPPAGCYPRTLHHYPRLAVTSKSLVAHFCVLIIKNRTTSKKSTPRPPNNSVLQSHKVLWSPTHGTCPRLPAHHEVEPVEQVHVRVLHRHVGGARSDSKQNLRAVHHFSFKRCNQVLSTPVSTCTTAATKRCQHGFQRAPPHPELHRGAQPEPRVHPRLRPDICCSPRSSTAL
jgi:hypothetical protein